MLRGDPSDGLPGVPGIGAKTAATLVGRFDSWTDLCAAVLDRGDRRLAPPIRAKLAAAAGYLAVVEPVVRVALDAPVRLDRPDRLPAGLRRPGPGGRADRALGAQRLGRPAGRRPRPQRHVGAVARFQDVRCGSDVRWGQAGVGRPTS